MINGLKPDSNKHEELADGEDPNCGFDQVDGVGGPGVVSVPHHPNHDIKHTMPREHHIPIGCGEGSELLEHMGLEGDGG